MNSLFKFAIGGLGAFGAWEGARYIRGIFYKANLQLGRTYSFVLGYRGAGVGGALSVAQIQAFLDASLGKGTMMVESTVTDPSKKTVSFLGTVDLGNPTVTTKNLTSGFPTSFGSMRVVGVTLQGLAPASSAVATT